MQTIIFVFFVALLMRFFFQGKKIPTSQLLQSNKRCLAAATYFYTFDRDLKLKKIFRSSITAVALVWVPFEALPEESFFIPFLPAFLLSDLSCLSFLYRLAFTTGAWWAQLLISSNYYLPSTPKDQSAMYTSSW